MIEPLESRQLLAAAPITVMTQNVYYGGGSGPQAFATAFTDLWDNVEQSNIPERAAAIANQIRRQKPDLVALQEAVIWRTGTAFSPSSAKDVRHDFVASIMRRLRKGLPRYKVVSRVTNADWEIPGQVGSSLRDIRMTDQDVILARVGKGSRLKILDADHGNYRPRFSVDIPIIDEEIDFTRGWASVDARIKGGPKFRFISTHLEILNTRIQRRQAKALLRGPAKTRLPVILAGDFNSDANIGGGTYNLLAKAGFDDAWKEARPGQLGPTCCQDDDLRNSDSELFSRIDWIMFSRKRIDATAADRVGEEPADKTRSGLWPSDHAGVVAQLQID